MKKTVFWLTAVLLLFTLASCTQYESTADSVRLYYPRSEYTAAEADSVISYETAEFTDKELPKILESYLQGPKDNRLTTPFPASTKLVQAEQKGNIIALTLSKEFAELTGVKLTVACCCLTQTILSLTDAETVEIAVQDGVLDGKQSIILDMNTVSFLDDALSTPQTEITE